MPAKHDSWAHGRYGMRDRQVVPENKGGQVWHARNEWPSGIDPAACQPSTSYMQVNIAMCNE